MSGIEEREPVDFEPMEAVEEDGWSEWIHPLPGYLMKCCDCGLVHEMEAVPARVVKRLEDGTFEWEPIEGDAVVMFRMRR